MKISSAMSFKSIKHSYWQTMILLIGAALTFLCLLPKMTERATAADAGKTTSQKLAKSRPDGKTSAPRYDIVSLGDLAPTAINNHGQIITSTDWWIENVTPNGSPYHSSYLWQGGKITNLGRLDGRERIVALSINDSGEVFGTAGDRFSLADTRPDEFFLWQNGHFHHLQVPKNLGSSADFYTGSKKKMLNNRGQLLLLKYVNVDQTRTSPTRDEYLLSKGKWLHLGVLSPNNKDYRVSAMNDHAQLVGFCTINDSSPIGEHLHAFLWDAHGLKRDLGTLGLETSIADDINNRGQIVGSVSDPHAPEHAFLWEKGHMRDLGALPGFHTSYAVAINDSGEVVGNVSTGDPNKDHAFLWRDGKMVDLNTLIPSNSGWVLERAIGINNRGQIIGGGLHNGKRTACLLTPHQSSLPKPHPSTAHGDAKLLTAGNLSDL